MTGKIRADFCRHASSEFNEGVHKLDPNITETGKKQASQVEGEWDLVVVSSLARCIQTLQHSKIRYRHLMVSELCREYRGGGICDYKEGEAQTAESLSDVDRRMTELKNLLRNLSQTYPRILVITHGVWMSLFMGLGRGVYNCEMISYEF